MEYSLAQSMSQVFQNARENTQGRPPSIYKPPQQIESLVLLLGKSGGHRTHIREPPDAGTLRPVHRCQPRVTLLKISRRSLTATCKPPGAVK